MLDNILGWDTLGTGIAVVVALSLCVINISTIEQAEKDERLRTLQIRYLVVYSLAVCADWLQGPYMYALYESYGFSVHSINLLFVGGFGASLSAGTVIGSFADKYGRKLNVLLYVFLYILSCMTKHSTSFYVLFIGRITGGIATSILFSAFESWLVYEHKNAGLLPDLLSTTFSYATLLNSAMAIVSGFIAQTVVNATGEFVSSFDASIVVLILTGIVTARYWNENYGDTGKPMLETLKDSWNIITASNDRKPLLLGVGIALFEAAMYMFVLEWTPAVKEAAGSEAAKDIPYGLIFASFMISCMAGSLLFKFCRKRNIYVEKILTYAVGLSALCLLCPVMPITSASFPILFCAFITFELCVGLFWPATATLRSLYLSEESRCTIMNFYRVPLNFAVVVVLCFDLNYSEIFILAVSCLCISGICFGVLENIRKTAFAVRTVILNNV